MAAAPPDHPGDAGGLRSIGEIAIQTNRATAVVPALPPLEPRFSETLGNLVSAARQPHPDVGLAGQFLPEHLRPEARTALDRYDQLIAPVQVQRLFDWLDGVNSVLATPLSRADVMAKASAYVDSLRDIPEVCFNADTRREAQVKYTFFPSAAEIHAVLHPHAMALHGKRHALRRLIGTEPPPVHDTLDQETPERKEEILAKFRADIDQVMAERLAAEPMPRPAPVARHLTREQLRASYRQAAAHPDTLIASAARTRLRMLGDDAPERAMSPVPNQEDPDNHW